MGELQVEVGEAEVRGRRSGRGAGNRQERGRKQTGEVGSRGEMCRCVGICE